MSQTVMSLKTDKELKEEAQKVAKNLGFPLGTLLNAYMRQLVRDKQIHHSIEPEYHMSSQLENDIKEFEKDLESGKNISGPFGNANDLIDSLHKSL